jgi:hypothetical protein
MNTGRMYFSERVRERERNPSVLPQSGQRNSLKYCSQYSRLVNPYKGPTSSFPEAAAKLF